MPTANQTPAFGGTFSITQPVSDGSGHITGMNSRTVKIPNNVASTSTAGLMSAADKKKLNELPGVQITSGTVTINYGFIGTKTVNIPHTVDLFAAYREDWGEVGLSPADGKDHAVVPVKIENTGSGAVLTLDAKSSAPATYTYCYYAFKLT